MKFLKKIKDRYNILTAVTFLLLAALTFRLASLTIAQGDYYRQVADTKRIKEIYTTAPRGEIRDRYGRLLAGNVPRFTVQLLKDEFSRIDLESKNQSILELIRLLEEDGVNYVSEYPIDFNVFKYNSLNEYLNSEEYPIDRVVNLILENNLISKILESFYIHSNYQEHFTFITANRAIHALKTKGMEIPVDVRIENSEVIFFYTDEDEIQTWKDSLGLSENADAKSSIVQIIGDDTSVIRSILDHPISRKLVYDILVENNLHDNIVLKEYANIYEENYLARKISLMSTYDEVTLESSAKDDFVNIFLRNSIENFLYRVFEDEEKIIPGKILIDMIEKMGEESPVSIDISGENDNIVYSYIGTSPLTEDESPVDKLIEKAKELDLLKGFIVSNELKRFAQQQLLEDGVNPRISIATFEYAEKNNLNDFYEKNKIEEGSSPEEAFKVIVKNYEIDEALSKYEQRSILMIHQILEKQGHLAYQPINIAYGIKDVTVARIEESLAHYDGINISIEPVRYYPGGHTAAHILGTLGKISQPHEIEKYVVENNYSPNAIIGKTGIEQSFEDALNGKNGIKKVEVDVVGNTTNTIEEEKAIPGDTVYLTIDAKLQKVAEEALKQTLEKIQVGGVYESKWGNYPFGINRSKGRPYENATSGAVVAIEVKTGQVLAMASYPAYDPNLFATGISSSDWQRLFPEDEDNPLAPRPLYNISTQTAVQPGSTFKMVTALAALDKGLSPHTRIRDMGYVMAGGIPLRCLVYTNTGGTHGLVNLYDALEVSCNYYFYTLALGRNQRTGQAIEVKLEIEDIVDMSKQLGLNDKSGIEINVPAEASGGVPNPIAKLINTKNSFRNWLNYNIKDYIKDGVTFDDKELEEIKEEIVNWLEFEEEPSRSEIVQRLDALGIAPERILEGEREGIADRIKFTYMREAQWDTRSTLWVTIGQEQSAYTPIQMANMVATLTNGGYRHNLTLIDSIKSFDNSETIYEYTPDFERIRLNDYDDLEHIKIGMKRVSDYGTARRVFANLPIETGSKTGTAETGVHPVTKEEFDNFAWFVGFAPFEDPEIAVAALIFQGGTGGYAGPMVRDIMAEYLGLNMDEADDSLPYGNSSLNP